LETVPSAKWCLNFYQLLDESVVENYANNQKLLDPAVSTDEGFLQDYMNGDRTQKIIRRVCPNCADSHKEIYYKRLTAVPDGLNMIDLFQSNWVNAPANMMGTDFTLHSSLAHAQADTEAWAECNFNDPDVGFPRDCGPSVGVGLQWNSFVGHSISGNGQPVAFYSYNEYTDECPHELGVRTDLEEAWRVGPFSVAGQTLSLRYGSIGDGTIGNKAETKRVIEFYARSTPTNADAGESIELNCFRENGGVLQLSPAGFGIVETEDSEGGKTQLAITFKREEGEGNSI
jgi:hypothetical protein